MTPTGEVDTTLPSSIDHGRSKPQAGPELEGHPRLSTKDPLDLQLSLDDCDNSCETYFCCRDSTPVFRSTIPEASAAFRETMETIRSEKLNDVRVPQVNSSGSATLTVPSSTSISARAKSSSKTSAMSSSASSRSPSSYILSHLSPNCLQTTSKTLSAAKSTNSRRPASFGGADVVKPRAARRASQCEKRVSWADEKGSDHQLITIRLIRPRLGKEVNTATHIQPGHSILRNTGVC